MTVSRFVAVATETAFGTGATGWKKIRVTGIGDPINRNPAFEEAIDIAAPTYGVAGPFKVNGTLDGTLRINSMGKLLNSLMGTPATAKTWLLGDTPAPISFKIGDDQGGQVTLYEGCGISSMELTLATKEFVKARFTWIGARATASGTDDITDYETGATTDEPAVFYSSYITVGGTAIKCKQFTLKIDRKFDEDYIYIGSPFLQGLYMNGQTEVSGTITLGSGDWDQLKTVMTGNTVGGVITAPALGSVTAVGTDSLNELPEMTMVVALHDRNGVLVGTINAGKCLFSESNRSVTGRNQWEKTINYRVIVPTSNAFSIVAV